MLTKNDVFFTAVSCEKVAIFGEHPKQTFGPSYDCGQVFFMNQTLLVDVLLHVTIYRTTKIHKSYRINAFFFQSYCLSHTYSNASK